MINIRCFDYKLNWIEVCSKYDVAYFLGMLQYLHCKLVGFSDCSCLIVPLQLVVDIFVQ